jgi:hypothetical protein
MKPCPHRGWNCFGCDDCRRQNNQPVPLTDDERSALRTKLILGQPVNLDAVTLEDRYALEPFDVRRRRAERAKPVSSPAKPVSESLPERLREHRDQYDDGERYLLTCSESDLLAAVGNNASLFDEIMRKRAERAAYVAATRPKPKPPQPTREQITADVLARHARGDALDDIAHSIGIPYSLALYITDQK